MKRLVSGLLALMMLCSLLTGCGGKDKDASAEGGRLVVGIPQKSTITDYDNNAYTKYLEENTGVKIKFTYFSNTASEYKQQLALMASSGEDGYFLDLTDLIEKYADTYKEKYKTLTDTEKEYVDLKCKSMESDAIYALPEV